MQQIYRLLTPDPDGEDASARSRIADFERLLALHERDITGYVFAILPNWADTEEVVQRTRIVLWRKFARFKPGTDFRLWAIQVARFEIMNFRKTQGSERFFLDDSLIESIAVARSSMSDELDRKRAVLDKCIRKLRASDRQIVRHCYGPQATTTKDAALKLKRPVNTLYKALNRIRRSLMLCVQQSQ